MSRLSELARSIALGAVLGLPILGGGGRLAMRVIAAMGGAPSAVTIEGTITVLLAGAGSGAAAGAIHQLLTWGLGSRPRLRTAVFGVVLGLLLLRGLNPVRATPLALFAPVMLVFGIAYSWAWSRRASVVRAEQRA